MYLDPSSCVSRTLPGEAEADATLKSSPPAAMATGRRHRIDRFMLPSQDARCSLRRHHRPPVQGRRTAARLSSSLRFFTDAAGPVDLPVAADLELAEDASHLALDGVDADLEPSGYLGIAEAFGGEPGHQPLPRGEPEQEIPKSARSAGRLYERSLGQLLLGLTHGPDPPLGQRQVGIKAPEG